MEGFNLSKAKAAVDEIITRLERRFNRFNISEIWKAGSLGHGTAVPGHYDIDLVLYSRDINTETVLAHNGFLCWVAPLKKYIDREFQVRSTTDGYYHRSVQFDYDFDGVKLSVDLLVSPFWNNPGEFYQFLRCIPRESRSMFTVSASKWQVEFFRTVDNEAKEYIYRAKHWRNVNFGDREVGRPSSYLMSLLVLKAYEMAKIRNPRAGAWEVKVRLLSVIILALVTECLKAVQPIIPLPIFTVCWEGENYRLEEYADLVPACPFVIDPANPANDVWKSGINGGNPYVLIRKIATIDLSTPSSENIVS